MTPEDGTSVPKRVGVNMRHKGCITECMLGGYIDFNIMFACTHTFCMCCIPFEFSDQNVFIFHLCLHNNNNNNNNNNNVLKSVRIQDIATINTAYNSETRICTTC